MHPNAFLKSLWRTEILDQVFVAMSFQKTFKKRFEKVIKPAIESEPFSGIELQAYRVDNSKTGDSILTDIVHGIAHSRLVLADVSVVDTGLDTKKPVRNGNVMYEVGVALACRNPSDVLLIRDDKERFLFDVSTIPHITKGCINTLAVNEETGTAFYALNPFGYALAKFAENLKVKIEQKES